MDATRKPQLLAKQTAMTARVKALEADQVRVADKLKKTQDDLALVNAELKALDGVQAP